MEDDEIVRTIITLGRNLGLKVIAEGVENLEQVMKLKGTGMRVRPGYYFSVPVSAEGATDLLLAQKHWPDSLKTACERWPVGTGAIHRMINTEFGPHS